MANYCFAFPMLPGGEERMRNWIRDMQASNPDHDEVFREAGISREQVWIQRTPMGDLAIASLEAEDRDRAFQVLATSTHPWAAKFREFLMAAHGVDITQPSEPNEKVADWQATREPSKEATKGMI
jgi:hypothetical protein